MTPSQMQSQKKRHQICNEIAIIVENATLSRKHNRNFTSAQILPTVEIVSTGYKPRRVSAPRRMASLPAIKTIVSMIELPFF
jgi:hypothetical protein